MDLLAHQASFELAAASNEQKSAFLKCLHGLLLNRKEAVLAANALDLSRASEMVKNGLLQESLLKRLDLGPKFDSLLSGILDVDNLADPVGVTSLARQLDDGLELYKVSCPIGVVLIIFEARPEVIIQISCLTLKSGNCVILKGGKEAQNSNEILYHIIQEALVVSGCGISPHSVSLVSSRDEIATLLKSSHIDLVIPRGSGELVRYIKENTIIPVLGHADGICAVYVDKDADLEKAIKIVVDSKTNYPAACNSLETLLVHREVLDFVHPIIKSLQEKSCKVRADREIIAKTGLSNIQLASSNDFSTEFLGLEIAMKTVGSFQEAISHINQYGSHHTDCIVTENENTAKYFLSRIDSAGVYWNASTRFADGFRYGFGAEIGVSTNKIHARGPVGLDGLMSYKYKLLGNGHCVADYNHKSYNRKELA